MYGLPNQAGHHRTISFIRGGFSKPTRGFEPGLPVRKREISAAIRAGQTVFLNGVQYWSPVVAGLAADLSRIFGRMTSVNMYATGGGVPQSASPHNDVQCTLIIQLAGRKRWRLWPAAGCANALTCPSLSVGAGLLFGKQPHFSRPIDSTALGAPVVDVLLEPGQALYVPRGTIHATQTPGDRKVRGVPFMP